MKPKRKPTSFVIYVSTRKYKGHSRQFNINGVKFFVRAAASRKDSLDSLYNSSRNESEFLLNTFDASALEELK